MFDLFRFVMLRPAVPREPHEIISTTDETDLQRRLTRDQQRSAPIPAMEQTSNQFLASERAVLKHDSLAFAGAYDALAASLRASLPDGLNTLLFEIANAFDFSAADLVGDQRFFDDRQRLADTLIAAKLGTPRIDVPVEVIARDLRLIALIQRAGDGDALLDSTDGIQAALVANIALPDGMLPVTPHATPTDDNDPRPPDDGVRRREALVREYSELNAAHDFLRDLSPDNVMDHDAAAGGGSGTTDPTPTSPDFRDSIFRELREIRDAVFSANTPVEGRAGLAGSTVTVAQGTSLRVRREVLANSSDAVQSGLRSARVDLASSSISDAADRINDRLRELAPQVYAQPGSGASVSLVGGQFVATSQVPDLMVPGARRENA